MPYQIKNGIVYGSNAVSLTQAQYDALSTAEKNNGTVYYIYDSDAVLDASDVGIDGGGNLQDLVGSVATIETSPATATHAVGDYIVYNGQLYEVTAAIAVGETLTVGTNITATTVGDELTSLNNGLAPRTLSLSSDYTLTNASFRMGKLIAISFKVAGLNGSSNIEAATIQQEYAPYTEVPIMASTNSGVYVTGWIRASSGVVVIAPRSALSNAEARVIAVYKV